MTIARFWGMFILATLAAGCSSTSLISPTETKGNSEAIVCQAPGTPQPTVCNYRLVVKHIRDNVFQGSVDPQVVMASEQYCGNAAANTQSGKDATCQNAEPYHYVLYTFEIEGEQPSDDETLDLVNIPNTNKLQKGHVGPRLSNLEANRGSRVNTTKAESN